MSYSLTKTSGIVSGSNSIITTQHSNLATMNDTEKTELKIRKGLLVTTIIFVLIFAGFLIFFSVHENWSLCVPIGVLMLMSVYNSVRLFRMIKRDSKK